MHALLKALHDEAKEQAVKVLSDTRAKAGKTLATRKSFDEAVTEFGLTTNADFTAASRALDEAANAAKSDTYYGYLDAICLCVPARQSFELAMTHFVASARAEVQQRLANNGTVSADYEWAIPLAGLVSMILGAGACKVAPDWSSGIGNFFGWLIMGWPLLIVVIRVVIYVKNLSDNSQRDRTRARLHQLDSELQMVQAR